MANFPTPQPPKRPTAPRPAPQAAHRNPVVPASGKPNAPMMPHVAPHSRPPVVNSWLNTNGRAPLPNDSIRIANLATEGSPPICLSSRQGKVNPAPQGINIDSKLALPAVPDNTAPSAIKEMMVDACKQLKNDIQQRAGKELAILVYDEDGVSTCAAIVAATLADLTGCSFRQAVEHLVLQGNNVAIPEQLGRAACLAFEGKEIPWE